MREMAGYIPNIGEENFDTKFLRFEGKLGKLEVEVPHLNYRQMEKVIQKVKTASATTLKSMSVNEIVSIIDRVIERLLNRNSNERKRLEELLPYITAFDHEMIRLSLTSYLKSFRKAELQRFLVEDFGNPLMLDDFQPRVKRGFSKAIGPDLITHIWAGNVPGLPLWSFISGLLVKAGNIGKVSSAEPLFAGWFARLVAEVEPRLADCFAVVWWKGGDEERERFIFNQSEVVIGYGSNDSLEAIANRIPITTRFLPFGHKISFGVITSSSLDSKKAWGAAHEAALDSIRFDQQGCYSPHLFYVQNGGAVSPIEFAKLLAHELDCFERRFPRHRLSIEEAASVASWRNSEQVRQLSRSDIEILGNEKKQWSVVYEEDGNFSPTCLNRNIRVMAFDRIEELVPQLNPYKPFLQTVGVATNPKELFHFAQVLGEVGVTRITALGKMTSPEAGWHHDGRFNLNDLIKMVDIEQSAEDAAERLAPYID
ncbi:acyl-CoA reductase [Bacillus carboniphilus]|uniref:Acyl-CoA reductase n=1 Tax=Bacillus carboniphilus TaxID=86663 RepID=A0ABN0VV12_9BACI